MNLALTIKKTTARLIAVQAIYADDIRSEDRSISNLIINIITCYNDEALLIDDVLESTPIDFDEKYFTILVTTIIENKAEIDESIIKYLTNDWRLEKLSAVMRSILRAGICELKYFFNIPYKVSINEYTNLAREFYSESEVGFVNGILDKIARETRVQTLP